MLVAPYVMSIAAAMRRGAAAIYRREFGLGRNEWRIMALLGIDGTMSNNEIAERVALDKGQLSREVSRLVKRGLVMRRRVRRMTQISLTEDGQRVYRQLHAIATRRNRRLLAGIGQEDRERLFELLNRIYGHALDMLRNGEDAA